MRIVDVFPFCDEIDLARIRLAYLDQVVDKFIIGEYNSSFSGEQKKYYFPQVIKGLPDSLRRKIEYIRLEQERPFADSFQNDDFQKNNFVSSIESLFDDDDYILIGDCDEFPSISGIHRSNTFLRRGSVICHFAQQNFLGYLNLRETTGCLLSFTGDYRRVWRQNWLGTVMTTSNVIRQEKFSGVRNPKWKVVGKRIGKGGWHFSSCNGSDLSFEERIRMKYRFTAHQELNKEEFLIKAQERLHSGKDPFGRSFNRRFLPGKIYPQFRVINAEQELPFNSLVDWNEMRHLVL